MPRATPRRAMNRITTRPIGRRTRLHSTAEAAITRTPAMSREMWKARRPKLMVGGLILALVAALFVFFDTDQFYLFDFQVAGLQHLTKPEIARASGIAGYNIFFVETQQVERALVKLPEVKFAQVTASMPNHLTIAIEERKPEFAWVRGGETYWVDAEGIAFKARTNLPALPVMHDLDQTSVKPGQTISPAAFAALRALRDAWRESPRAFEWSTARGLSFSDERGWKIYLGDAEEMAGKLAEYRALVAMLLAQKIQVKFIDLGKGDPYYQ
ncbi:MAG: FtsQ-type POTRA domain-containing protein [Chloroflexi bacterium]|nr:FtsQ-type POTRA domain-containing protein [Chloroflexota bacterium]